MTSRVLKSQQHIISLEIQGFMLDRRVRNLSPLTLQYYTIQLAYLSRSCHFIEDITPPILRQGVIDHGHAWYRAVKAFLLWYERENEDLDWHNPIRKVTPPKRRNDPLPGITPANIAAMINACPRNRKGQRDKIILLMLFDTGMRVSELCALNVDDVVIETGEVTIRHGKGDKPRTVFIGVKTRKELVKYLRGHEGEALFYGRFSLERITRRAVATMMELLAAKVGIPKPTPHDFRRAFTKAALKYADVDTVARWLGHTSTALVWRYHYQDTDDLREAHGRASPADRL